jgi:hypothetical protein
MTLRPQRLAPSGGAHGFRIKVKDETVFPIRHRLPSLAGQQALEWDHRWRGGRLRGGMAAWQQEEQGKAGKETMKIGHGSENG